jgi:hypothetical protein
METATNYRYIVKTEGIRGGNARIEGTRIGVHDVIGAFCKTAKQSIPSRTVFPILLARRFTSAWPITKTIVAKSIC